MIASEPSPIFAPSPRSTTVRSALRSSVINLYGLVTRIASATPGRFSKRERSTAPWLAVRALAGRAARGARRTGHDVRAEAERFDHADHVVDFAPSGVGVHYDEHGVKRRLLTKNYTSRSNLP